MSLLEKASIITTPTAYGVGVLNSIKPAIPVGDGDFDFARTSTATRVNEDYLIETVAANIPRLDYSNGVAQILVEPESTNLVTYSEDFSQWTPNFGASITSNSIVSPNGTQNASKLIPSSSVERQAITIELTPNGDISMSVFAKKGEYSVIQFSDAINPAYFINFDLQTGLIGSSDTMQGKIENVGNDWYRCSASYSSSNSILKFRLSIAESSTSGRLVDFAGNSSDGLYIWAAQLENLTYPTSYIPTSGTTITRAAETLSNAGNSDLINSTEGTLYCEIAALSNDGTRRGISISDGTATNNSVRISFHSVSSTIRAQIRAEGSLVASLSYVVPDTKDFHKVALSFDSNRARLFVDGVRVGLDTSVTTPTGLNTLAFSEGGTSNPFYGKCKTVAVFKEALSESEMACLTSTGNREIFLNYYYRMHYVGANIDALSCAEKTFNV
jgi:hypothetical protein